MDAKKLGPFIASRRKELGLTQLLLAEKLHVTDKAVSRWERGVGLPDIQQLEALAEALDVSIVELMQARRREKEQIPAEEAEQLLIDTIHLSKTQDRIIRAVGGAVLGGFVLVSLLMLLLLAFDGKTLLFPVTTLLAGLAAWGVPIWRAVFAPKKKAVPFLLLSVGFAFLALLLQFFEIAHHVHIGDLSAIEDTIDALAAVCATFVSITMLLNILSMKKR